MATRGELEVAPKEGPRLLERGDYLTIDGDLDTSGPTARGYRT